MKALWIFVIAALAGSFAHASVPLTPDWQKISGKTLPDVSFTDAAGQAIRLSDYKEKILILHPMFSHCPSTCSVVSKRIAQAYKGLSEPEKAKLQILSFSFDPVETDQGLISFQKMLKADPANWKIVRTSPQRIQQMLDALDFKTLQLAQSNYEHANLIFVVSGDRVLRDYIFGGDLTTERLRRSIRIAEGSGSVSKSSLLVFAVAGLLISTFVAVGIWTRQQSDAGGSSA